MHLNLLILEFVEINEFLIDQFVVMSVNLTTTMGYSFVLRTFRENLSN